CSAAGATCPCFTTRVRPGASPGPDRLMPRPPPSTRGIAEAVLVQVEPMLRCLGEPEDISDIVALSTQGVFDVSKEDHCCPRSNRIAGWRPGSGDPGRSRWTVRRPGA